MGKTTGKERSLSWFLRWLWFGFGPNPNQIGRIWLGFGQKPNQRARFGFGKTNYSELVGFGNTGGSVFFRTKAKYSMRNIWFGFLALGGDALTEEGISSTATIPTAGAFVIELCFVAMKTLEKPDLKLARASIAKYLPVLYDMEADNECGGIMG